MAFTGLRVIFICIYVCFTIQRGSFCACVVHYEISQTAGSSSKQTVMFEILLTAGAEPSAREPNGDTAKMMLAQAA